MKFNYCILDYETNILNEEIGKMKASSFYPDNSIVLGLYKWCDDDTLNKRFFGTHPNLVSDNGLTITADMLKSCNMLVGHNIKFDLLYMKKFYNELYLDWINRGGVVWDTQIVEYLLSGQSHLYPTLNQVSEKYGGTQKEDKIKEYWDGGVDTAKIPLGELSDYLEGDVDNTELVFENQWELVDELGMLPLVTSQMDALLALVEMEYNGIVFDRMGSYKKRLELQVNQAMLYDSLVERMSKVLPNNIRTPINPSSSQQLSVTLFGGYLWCVKRDPVLDGSGNPVLYKSGINKGKIKTKKVEYKQEIKGYGLESHTSEKSAKGVYPTDDFALKKVRSKYPVMVPFINDILEYRIISKDISTYYEGIAALTFPDDKVHPNYNQCATATGRLSSTAPNAQNFSGDK